MSMQRPIVWVHGDCLSPHHPGLAAYPGAPAIFVWDEELLAALRISLKRIVFIYECLLELPVTIRRGDVAAEVLAFAGEQRADGIVTSDSPAPRFRRIRERLETVLPVRVMPLEPFVRAPQRVDLARFSRYWQAIQAEALSDFPDNAL
jgi:deoxyribodipyrimidine photo-lyase